MADPTEALKVLRAGLLLRMQRAREARARADAAIALREREATRDELREAERMVDASAANSATRLQQAWTAAEGGRIGLDDLMALRAAETTERAETVRLARCAEAVREKAAAAETAAANASADAIRAAAATARREHVAQFHTRQQHETIERLEEALREDDYRRMAPRS